MQELNSFNTSIATLGYGAVTSTDSAALHAVVGSQIMVWVGDCVQHREQSDHWDKLRSVLMAVSQRVTDLLAKNQISAVPERRIAVFLEHGRPLRAAITTLSRPSEPGAMSAAEALLRSSFKATAAELKVQIASKVHKVFATRAAVAFEIGRTKTEQGCLQIEGAGRTDSRAPIHWESKIVLQLSDAEVLQLLAVLRNYQPVLEITGHGKQFDKRFSCVRQAGGWKVSVRKGSVAHTVPMPAFEAYKVVAMGIQVLLANSPHLTSEMITQLASEMAAQSLASL